jgi:hypothetical protein
MLIVLTATNHKAKSLPHVSLNHWTDDSARTWLRVRVANPRWLDCLVKINVGGQDVTNFLVFARADAVVDVLQGAVKSDARIVVHGTFETPTAFPQRMLEILRLRQKRVSVFGKSSTLFLIKDTPQVP